jgi:hypothetical protein
MSLFNNSSLGYDPRPMPSLLRVGMKLSDPDLLKTAEPLIYIFIGNNDDDINNVIVVSG